MGFRSRKARAIVGLYNGFLPTPGHQPDSYRDDLLLTFQDTMSDGLDTVEELVEEGRVGGNTNENLEEIGRLRQSQQALLDKLTALTEDQARQIYTYAIGFWESQKTA